MKYKISVNWYGELMIFWRHAASVAQVKSFVYVEMGKILGIETSAVRRYYMQGKDNLKVEEVT